MMFDLHLHLLPGIDDGAATLDVSRQMLERAKANGMSTLVATPHLPGPLSPSYAERVEQALERVRAIACPLEIDVKLGYEVMLTPDLPARLEGGELSTLAASKTVLVEVPFRVWPAHADQALFDLQVAGFRPLLAHPERYHGIQKDPAQALRLSERGIVLQVTFGSLLGLIGNDARHAAEVIVQSADAVVMSTDAHSDGKRLAAVKPGLARLRDLVGEARAKQLVEVGPRAILSDSPMPAPVDLEPLPAAGKWGGRIRRLISTDR
jgi:protein-tyrosine phosphatase